MTHVRIVQADAGIDDLVLPSDSRGALASGPGLVPGSGVPGSATPMVIVGHRTTNGAVFSHLSDLRPDQLIAVHDVHGSVLQYRVERVAHVAPGSFISEQAGPQALYLVTSSRAYLASGRLVVVARLMSGATTVAGADQSVRIPPLGGSRTDLALAVLLLAGLAWGWATRMRLASRLPAWAYWGAWAPAALVTFETSRLLLAAMSRVA